VRVFGREVEVLRAASAVEGCLLSHHPRALRRWMTTPALVQLLSLALSSLAQNGAGDSTVTSAPVSGCVKRNLAACSINRTSGVP
jgi:hypothetical protein